MNKYIWCAGLALIVVFYSYVHQFYLKLGFPISKDQAVWGQLGDFMGGLLNPIFGFISIILLIQSLKLQFESNKKLIEQINNTKRTEDLKSFENLFFNLIDVKNGYFSRFEIDFDTPQGRQNFKRDVAVDKLEIIVQQLKNAGQSKDQIIDFLKELNDKNNIFSQVRCFYVLVKLIDDQLIEVNNFTIEDRKLYFRLLINFTEFAHLRLVVMSMQFLDFESTRYLNSNSDFISVLDELNFSLNPY